VAVVADREPAMKPIARSLLHLLAPFALANACHAEPVPPARLLPAQSEISFQLKQSGVPVDGKFKRFDAQLALDPKAPQGGSVTVSIDTGSATVGFPETDVELPRAPWFDTAKYPRAVFQSSAIGALGSGRFQAQGKLELKGTARELVIPVAIVQSGPQSTATGEFIVKRLDYKIGDGEWTDLSLVANDVRVRFKLVFTGLAPL
jgi:polyisoprenoid-binding protein YceI